jgi:hypothetical protein
MDQGSRNASGSCDSDTMPSDSCSWEDMLLRLVEQEDENEAGTLIQEKGPPFRPDATVSTDKGPVKSLSVMKAEPKVSAPSKGTGFKPSMFSLKQSGFQGPASRAPPPAEAPPPPPAIVPIILRASDDSALLGAWRPPSLPVAMFPVACASIVLSLPLTVDELNEQDTFSTFLRSMHNMSFSRPIGSFTTLVAGERYTGVTVPPHMDSTPFRSYNSVSVVGTFDPSSATLTKHFAEERIIGSAADTMCVSVRVQCKIQNLFEALLKSKLTHSFLSVVGGASLSNCATHLDLELQSDPIHPDSINHMGSNLDSFLAKSLGLKRTVAITVVPKHALHLLGGTNKDITSFTRSESIESDDYLSDNSGDNDESMWDAVGESRASTAHLVLLRHDATYETMGED